MATRINERSTLNKKAFDKREILRDFKEGESAIKRRSKFYLPRFPTEDEATYKDRVNSSFLYNILAIAINRIANKPLNKQVQIITDNEELKATMWNFDNDGRTLLDFTRDFLSDSLWYNQGYVFVEGDNVSIIDVDNILQTQVENSELIFIRFKDIIQRRNGWDDELLEVVRVFEKIDDKVYYSIYVQEEEGSSDFIEEVFQERYFIDEIPMCRYYPFGTKYEFFPELTFLPMADIQKVLFRLDSDIINMMGVAAVPFLFFKGVDINDDENPLVISSFNAVAANTEYADVKYVEATCSSLNFLRQERDSLIEKAQTLTIDLMSRHGGNQSATSATIDEANNNSMMSCVAVGLKEFLEKIISMKYKFKKGIKEPEFSVNLTTNFNINTNAEELNFIVNAVNSQLISKKQAFLEGQRRGIISNDSTFEQNQQDITVELEGSSSSKSFYE